MYTEYFGFNEPPFSIAPDPRYLYMSQRHREALAHLLYGVGENGGFVQLTGEVGTGKTTVIRVALEQLPENVDVALILNPRMTVVEFLAAICDELSIDYPKGRESLKTLIDLLNAYLLDAHGKGRRTVLFIDEAQNLSADVLEQVRLLTNLETTKHKLLQIFLIGQPELKTLLARNELRQVAQRITARYHLIPLILAETQNYIQHRLQVAGVKRRLFNESAVRLIQRLSGGVPRLINILCDRALLGAYARDKRRVDRCILKGAAVEVMGELPSPWYRSWHVYLPTALAMAVLVVGAWGVSQWDGARFHLQASAPPGGGKGTEAAVSSPPGEDARVVALAKAEADAEGGVLEESAQDDEPSTDMPQSLGLQEDSQPVKNQLVVRSLDEILRNPQIHTDTQSAFSRLFALWGFEEAVVAPKNVANCEWAASHGLHCLYRHGTWNNLRKFNRPALIELLDSRGLRHHVLVSAMGDATITLDFAGQEHNVDLDALNPYWYGSFLLLWKSPLTGVKTIWPGSRSNAVVWLRRRLAEIHGVDPIGPPKDHFDEDLKDQVKAFQRRRHLVEDGIVGTQTFIHLNTAIRDPSIPVLDVPVDAEKRS